MFKHAKVFKPLKLKLHIDANEKILAEIETSLRGTREYLQRHECLAPMDMDGWFEVEQKIKYQSAMELGIQGEALGMARQFVEVTRHLWQSIAYSGEPSLQVFRLTRAYRLAESFAKQPSVYGIPGLTENQLQIISYMTDSMLCSIPKVQSQVDEMAVTV